MFSLLNRLEKLDGAFNVMFPKATLELRVPLAAKKGMLKCEMLIMQLYPWLSITETSTNTVSSTLNMAMLIGIAVDKGQIKSIDVYYEE